MRLFKMFCIAAVVLGMLQVQGYATMLDQWSLDENPIVPGTTSAIDSVGTVNLLYQGGVASATGHLGVANTAVHFDGVNGKANSPHGPILYGQPAFSVDGFFKLDAGYTSGSPFQTIYSEGNPTNGAPSLMLYIDVATNTLRFQYQGTNLVNAAVASPTLVADHWYYAAGTFDGASVNAYLYDAGTLYSGTAAYLGTPNKTVGNIYIGAIGGAVPKWMKGSVDDVATYNTALSVAELTAHATAGVTPEPSTLALLATGLMGLLAYAWRKRK